MSQPKRNNITLLSTGKDTIPTAFSKFDLDNLWLTRRRSLFANTYVMLPPNWDTSGQSLWECHAFPGCHMRACCNSPHPSLLPFWILLNPILSTNACTRIPHCPDHTQLLLYSHCIPLAQWIHLLAVMLPHPYFHEPTAPSMMCFFSLSTGQSRKEGVEKVYTHPNPPKFLYQACMWSQAHAIYVLNLAELAYRGRIILCRTCSLPRRTYSTVSPWHHPNEATAVCITSRPPITAYATSDT